MNNCLPVWTDQYKIFWADTDCHNRASLTAICRYLQESAWNHANHLGFGYMEDGKIRHTWVIVRLLVKMERYPRWEDKITIRTWPRGMDGLLAMRDFEILDESGARIGAASSQWFIIDTKTRKPQPGIIVRDILPLATSTPVMEDQPSKILIREPLDHLATCKAVFSHIDLYGHVNNTRYVEWILDAIPEGVHRESPICSFLIEFLAETRLNDEVMLGGKLKIPEMIFRGVRTGDEKVIFRARVSF
jgi:medium-chain acyl-[acyl-carrier-protein] hydrolase